MVPWRGVGASPQTFRWLGFPNSSLLQERGKLHKTPPENLGRAPEGASFAAWNSPLMRDRMGVGLLVAYIVRRILVAIPVLLGVTVLTYFLVNLVPGNPVTMLISPSISAGNLAALKASLGLNQPVWVRYALWLGQVVRGNLGYSYSTQEPVLAMILTHLSATAELMGTSVVISYLIAVPLGVLVAVRQYSIWDYVTTVLAFVWISLPSFFVGLVMIYVFSLKLNWLPPSGQQAIGGSGGLLSSLSYLAMPATVLALGNVGATVRYVRAAVLEVIHADYIRTARAKGLAQPAVVYRHALRNALLPVITLLGLQIPLLFSGAIITEQVFGWPGMGQLTVSAINERDYPVIMGITLISAVMVVVGNLVADLLYAVADPRISYGNG